VLYGQTLCFSYTGDNLMKIVGLPSTQSRPMTSNIPMDMKHLGSEEKKKKQGQVKSCGR
jgi:hypothetical protein